LNRPADEVANTADESPVVEIAGGTGSDQPKGGHHQPTIRAEGGDIKTDGKRKKRNPDEHAGRPCKPAVEGPQIEGRFEGKAGENFVDVGSCDRRHSVRRGKDSNIKEPERRRFRP